MGNLFLLSKNAPVTPNSSSITKNSKQPDVQSRFANLGLLDPTKPAAAEETAAAKAAAEVGVVPDFAALKSLLRPLPPTPLVGPGGVHLFEEPGKRKKRWKEMRRE